MDKTKIANDNVQFEMRYYQEDHVVFYEGEHGDCLYDILQGSVFVFRNYRREGSKQLLAQLGPGDYFGELAILEAMPRNATIVAAQDGTVLRLIRAENFPAYAAQNPDKAFKIMQSMGASFHNLHMKYDNAVRVVGKMAESAKTRKKLEPEIAAMRESMLNEYQVMLKKENPDLNENQDLPQ